MHARKETILFIAKMRPPATLIGMKGGIETKLPGAKIRVAKFFASKQVFNLAQQCE